MRETVFIDSGFWIALVDQRDQYHSKAKETLKPLLKNHRLCLSDFILFEVLTYLNCSLKRHDLALVFLEKAKTPGISIFMVDELVKAKALAWFQQYSDKDLSITDCTTFVLMKSQGIRLYAGFDEHFQQMGFATIFSE